MSAELGVALSRVCRVLGAPRSTVYARRTALLGGGTVAKRGPKTTMDDDELLALIRQVIADSLFSVILRCKARAIAR